MTDNVIQIDYFLYFSLVLEGRENTFNLVDFHPAKKLRKKVNSSANA